MKKLTAILLTVLLCLSLGACKYVSTGNSGTTYKVTWATEVTSENVGDNADAYFYVYVGKTDLTAYAVEISAVEVTEGAFSVLKYLKETEGLTFEYAESTYGAYITAVGDCKAEGNAYVAIYTTYDDDKNVPGPYTAEMTVDKKTFVTSGIGASSMHVVGGESILLTIETY